MLPRLDIVPSDEALPRRTSVVVIGGGIIGVSTALSLAEKGIQVALCEKGEIGAEQSGRNWGWCRTQGRDPREIPLSMEAMRMWQGLGAKVQGETGFEVQGILYPCNTAADLAAREAWLDKVRIYQPGARMISGGEVDRLLPGATRKWLGGLHTPGDGRAEPQKAAPAIASGARRLGATIHTNCAVRGIETAAGRISGVVTERGRIACDSVVLAGGAWSRLFCGNHGIEFPQLKVRASVMRTAPLQEAPQLAIGTQIYAFRHRADGGYTIANRGLTVAEIVPDSFRQFFRFMPALKSQRSDISLRIGGSFLTEWRMPRRWDVAQATLFETVRTLDPAPDNGILDGAMKALVVDFPVFANARILERWAGMIDVTPDAVPVIGPVPSVPGFYLASGFSGHGFGIGPAAGRLMADLVAGDTPIVDPKPLRFERFTDGSPIVIH